MLVALDEGPGPPIKYQYAELAKLYAVVSQLIRCCDISSKCQSSVTGQTACSNNHGDTSLAEPLMPIQPQVAEILFNRGSYVKKLIEECNSSEETTKLLKVGGSVGHVGGSVGHVGGSAGHVGGSVGHVGVSVGHVGVSVGHVVL
ncbi:putative ubiquitin carboxyl-terminal hydrolase FAF-X [Lamellibrachia satsuma]|nr:putative ubiquitin carboxyl-terminal hydrolase FAF-X [Lamellibrachia satsuma]